MTRFLLISACLHVIVLLALQAGTPGSDSAPMPGAPLELALTRFSDPVTQPAVSTPSVPPRPAPAAPAPARPQPVEPVANAPLHDSAPAATQADNSAAAAAPPADHRQAVASLRAAVYSLLQARFSYPRRARQRGWQGTVVVQLRILPGGAVTDIHVARSSGIGVLDRAAVRSLADMHIPQHLAFLGNEAIDLEIPVEYRLTGT